MGNEKDETFFSRWSRRKAQVRQEAAPLAPPVAEAEQPVAPVAATVLATAPVAAALCAAVAASLWVVLAHSDEFAPESEEQRRAKYWIPEVGRGFQYRLNEEAAAK